MCMLHRLLLVLRPYCPGAGQRIHKNDDLPGPFHLLDMSGEWVLPEDSREQSGTKSRSSC